MDIIIKRLKDNNRHRDNIVKKVYYLQKSDKNFQMSQWKKRSYFCVVEHIYEAAFRRWDKMTSTKNSAGVFKRSDT